MPQGGATPVNIRLQPMQRDQSEDNSMTTESSSCATFNPWKHTKQSKKLQQIFGNDKIDEENPVVHKRPTKKNLYPQPSLRRYCSVRAARLVCIYSLDEEHPSHVALDQNQRVNELAYEHQCRC